MSSSSSSSSSSPSSSILAALPLPPDVIRRIIHYLDIDTRRTLGIPPKKLTASYYEPLRDLVFPKIILTARCSLLRLGPFRCGNVGPSIRQIPYMYCHVRNYSDDGYFIHEIYHKTNSYPICHSYGLTNWTI
jgi:hypothetical protein